MLDSSEHLLTYRALHHPEGLPPHVLVDGRMSTWSTPYITVADADGHTVDRQLPDPLPWPAGACADESLRTLADPRPADGKAWVRRRTPDHAGPRSPS